MKQFFNRDSYYWCGVVLVFTLCAQLFFTRYAWIPYHFDYPQVPLLNGFDKIPSAVCTFLFYSVFILLPLLLFQKIKKPVFIVLFIAFLVLVLNDVNRLQPWLIMNVLLLSLWVFKRNDFFFLMRVFLIALYFWSGLNKLNLSFAWEVFPYFMKAFGLNEQFYLSPEEIGNSPLPLINHLAWIVPLSEITIAIMLIAKATRVYALVGGVFLHLIIIFILGPLGLNWNSVVWLWNLEFIFLLIFLYFEQDWSFLKQKTKTIFFRFYFFLVALSPVIWFFGYWPHNFSYHLYSGCNPNIRFYFEGINMKIMESDLEEFTFYDTDEQQSYIMLDYYLMNKINLPVFAEEYYFKKTAAAFCECYGYDNHDAGLRIMAKAKFSGKPIIKNFPCKELVGD